MTDDRDDDDELDDGPDPRDDERDEPDMLEDTPPAGGHGGASFFAGFALGALLGVGAALLFAPARGAVTRKKLRRKLRSLKSEAADRIGDARDAAERELSRQRRRLRRHLPQR
jgi:hypothetical protein